MSPVLCNALLIMWSFWWLIFAFVADNKGRKKLAVMGLVLSFPFGWFLLLIIGATALAEKVLGK